MGYEFSSKGRDHNWRICKGRKLVNYETIMVKKMDKKATLALHRPKRENRINSLMVKEMRDAIQVMVNDDKVGKGSLR